MNYEGERKNQKNMLQKVCTIKNNPYLCTAIENKTIAKHVGNDWRDGRVVDCGGLENR